MQNMRSMDNKETELFQRNRDSLFPLCFCCILIILGVLQYGKYLQILRGSKNGRPNGWIGFLPAGGACLTKSPPFVEVGFMWIWNKSQEE